MFVIDASITMSWCFPDEATPTSEAVLDRLRDDAASVPPIWALEVANVLLVAERRGRIRKAQATRFTSLLGQLPIEIDDQPVDIGRVVAVGREHDLSSYDASYLELATRLGTPLATLDQRLGRAADAAGVELLASPPA